MMLKTMIAGGLVSLLLSAAGMPAAAQPYSAGMMRLPVTPAPASAVSGVPITVWYPTAVREQPVRMGMTDLSVALDAAPAVGRHRLVLISHGSEGSDLGHSELAQLLARRGFVVAAPRHLGDSYDDKSALASDRQFGGRPLQASAALDAILAHPVFSPAIDTARIGMIGYSAGGFTALVMAGAKPDRQNWIRHCREPVEHGVACPIGWFTSLWLRVMYKDWERPPEARIKAVVLMAPFGAMFDKAGLSEVRQPVLLLTPELDEMLPHPSNAHLIRDALPQPPEHHVVPGRHFIFIPPCSAELAVAAPNICIDAPGVDRPQIHRETNARIAVFLERTLGVE